MILALSLGMFSIGILGIVLRKNIIMSILSMFLAFSGVAGVTLVTILERNVTSLLHWPYLLFILGFSMCVFALVLVRNYFHESKSVMTDEMKSYIG